MHQRPAANRFPILWRFMIIMVLLLIVPIVLLTLVLQVQLKEDFDRRVVQILEGSLDALDSGLRAEMADAGRVASRMAADAAFIEQLHVVWQDDGARQEIAMWERHSQYTLFLRDPEGGRLAIFGRKPLEVAALDPERLRRAAQAPVAFLVAGSERISVADLRPVTLTGGKLMVFGLIAPVRDSLFDGLGTTFQSGFSVLNHQSGRVLFASPLARSIQGGLLSRFDRKVLDTFMASSSRSHYLKGRNGEQDYHGLLAKSELDFIAPTVLTTFIPQQELQPLDYSMHLLVFSVISIVLAGISGIILLRRVVKPLTFLSSEVNRLRYTLRHNESVSSIRMDSNDEISDVAHTFNALVRDLLESRQKIEEQRAQIVSYAHNLEERVQDRTRELEEAKIRAELASTQKSRFLVNMNHELRTPLNSITGLTELLRFGAYEKNDEFSDLLQAMVDQMEPEGRISPDTLGLLREIALRLKGEGNSKHSIVESLVNRYPESFNDSRMSDIIARLDTLALEEKASIRKAYGTIRDASNSLLNIINEVINLSRIESGVIEVSLERTRLRDVVTASMNHAEAYLRVKGKDKRLEFQVMVDDRIPEWLLLDGQKIKQVLLNFLTNAIKYTNDGLIQVAVLCVDAPKMPHVRCTVTDTGMGIAEKDKSQLFLEFARVFEVRDIEGSGLGLALSRKLVERMGGSIGFESELGRGSSFWFTIPLRCPV